MFKPWTSSEGPKVPEGWGIDVFRGRIFLNCSKCLKPLKLRDEYIYQYPKSGVLIFHNTKECTNEITSNSDTGIRGN